MRLVLALLLLLLLSRVGRLTMQRSHCTFGFNSPNSFAHFAVTMR